MWPEINFEGSLGIRGIVSIDFEHMFMHFKDFVTLTDSFWGGFEKILE